MQHIAPVINCLVNVEVCSLIHFRVLSIYLSVFKDPRVLKNIFKMSTNKQKTTSKPQKIKDFFFFERIKRVGQWELLFISVIVMCLKSQSTFSILFK